MVALLRKGGSRLWKRCLSTWSAVLKSLNSRFSCATLLLSSHFALLLALLQEEITHCAAGVKWFTYLCKRALEMGPSEAGGTTLSGANGSDSGHGRLPREQGASAKIDGAAATESVAKDPGRVLSTSEETSDTGVSGEPNKDQMMSADSQLVTESFAACSLDNPLVGRLSSQDTCQLKGECPDSGSGADGRERPAKEVGAKEFKQYVVSKFHEVVRRHFRGPLKVRS
jgi:hypothetical protein